MSNSTWDRCPTCGKYDFVDRHRCPPPWLVWEPDRAETDYDGARCVYAPDAEKAAEKWASVDDREFAEGAIAMQQHEPEVCVRKVGDDKIHRFKVRAEMVPEYRAVSIEGLARGEKEGDEQEECDGAAVE